MSQSAQSDLQSNVNDLEKAGVPRFHAFLILSVLKLSNDGAASLWWDSRNDSSASAIDTILGIEEADLIQIVLCHHSNVHAGIKDVARDLKRDLATSGTVSLEFFDPQVAPDCTPICFNVASVAIHTGGLPSTAAINACVNFGFQLGSAARDRYKLGNADYLALSESQSFFSGVLDTNTGVTSIRLRQGDLFRNEDRSQITGRLKRACDERRNVWIGESFVCLQVTHIISYPSRSSLFSSDHCITTHLPHWGPWGTATWCRFKWSLRFDRLTSS